MARVRLHGRGLLHFLAVVTVGFALSNPTICECPIDGKPLGRGSYLLRGVMSTPVPQSRIDDHPDLHPVEHPIPTAFSQMRVLLVPPP